MPRLKYKEANVPDGVRVRVRYIRDRRWFTSCHLIDKDDKIVACGASTCSYQDQPTRKIGRAIAVGRALKKYMEGTDVIS